MQEQISTCTQKKKNFTLFEKNFLLECILNHKNIVENKNRWYIYKSQAGSIEKNCDF